MYISKVLSGIYNHVHTHWLGPVFTFVVPLFF
jgi:hypothetical protein